MDLALPAGRIYGRVGPNGSGKSMLMKMLARQYSPAGGRISIGDCPLSALGDRQFARTIAYMPQFTPPAEGMTVDELVALGRFPGHGALGRFGPVDREKVDAALK